MTYRTSWLEPESSITCAREIKNLKLLTPTILDTIAKKVNEQEIKNSKDIRKLRQILKDPVAREKFISSEGTIDSALRTLGPVQPKKSHGLIGDIEQLSESWQRYPWTSLVALKGDQEVLRKLDEAEKLLKELKKSLAR
jgi:ParB family chromosome partitioning protein